MIRKTLAVLGITLLCLTTAAFTEENSEEQIAELQEEVKDLEKRMMKTERKAALDRINFSGDFRFEAHSIDSSGIAACSRISRAVGIVSGSGASGAGAFWCS